MVVLFRDVSPDSKDEKLKSEEVKVAPYNGKFVYSELQRFLDMFIEKEEGKSTKKI